MNPPRMEDLGDEPDGRLRSPSAARNRGEILRVLAAVMPPGARVLEVASGTGEHAVHFAAARPDLVWQPSERDPAALASIAAWRDHARLPNLEPPVGLDITAEDWGIGPVTAVVAINVLHIVPWSAGTALLAGAGRVLEPGGVLFLYGAMIRADRETAASNQDFDRRLRRRDPALGVRRLEDVTAAAAPRGLEPERVVDMPNNNSVVLLRRMGSR